MVPWANPSSQLKQYLDRFSGSCMAHDSDRTDRQTDHATPSVTVGRYVRAT